MDNKTNTDNEYTLEMLAKNPDMTLKPNLFVVVIDISEAKKQSNADNFTFRLKVLDQTFNYKEKIDSSIVKFHKFVHLNIYVEDLTNSPSVDLVGSILRIRRFMFKTTSKGELMGSQVKFSNWLLYSGMPNDSIQSYSYRNFYKNKTKELNREEFRKLNEIREWFASFLLQNSLRYICWWTDWKTGREGDEYVQERHEKIDLIVKILEQKKIKNKSILIVYDREGNKFQMDSNYDKIKQGDLLKLRCFNLERENPSKGIRQLQFDALSGCMRIPLESYDGRQFETLKNKKLLKKRGIVTNEHIRLKDYEMIPMIKGPLNYDLISALHQERKETKIYSIKALKIKLLNAATNNNKIFLFQGRIKHISSYKAISILKKKHIDTGIVREFSHIDTTKQERKWRVFFYFILTLNDFKSNDTIDVYVNTSNEDIPLFNAWNILPNGEDSEGWNDFGKDQMKLFESKLLSLINPNSYINAALKCFCSSKGQKFFKLCDTIFVN